MIIINGFIDKILWVQSLDVPNYVPKHPHVIMVPKISLGLVEYLSVRGPQELQNGLHLPLQKSYANYLNK